MKSLTEFPSFKLNQGLQSKAALAAEGKTPEEVQAGLGEAFKLEGEKLKYFVNALDVASQNTNGLTRIVVVSFNEGETVPPKAVKVEEQYYIPEFQVQAQHSKGQKAPPKPVGGRGGKGPRKDGPKT